jgi:hypothetical protein
LGGWGEGSFTGLFTELVGKFCRRLLREFADGDCEVLPTAGAGDHTYQSRVVMPRTRGDCDESVTCKLQFTGDAAHAWRLRKNAPSGNSDIDKSG